MADLAWAVATDAGCVRTVNEDAWFARPEVGVFGVADGMGSLAAGDVASKVVAETLPGQIEAALAGRDLRDSAPELAETIDRFSAQLRDESTVHQNLRGMGAAVVVGVLRQRALLVAHVGDCRAYLLRRGKLRLLTRDHTLAQVLVDRGELDAREARSHPSSAQLTRYLGMEGESLTQVRPLGSLQAGDRLMFCTDGLSGALGHADIEARLEHGARPDGACSALIESAKGAGARDNLTALVVDLPPSERTALMPE